MMTHLIQISNLNKESQPILAKNCTQFLQRLKGLMFVRSLADHSGILLDEQTDSSVNTSIHMLFMNFDITAVWINSSKQVVDVKLAKKWALAYFPKSPARYILETSSARINDFAIGDQLSFLNVE
ncbi:MAG: DUF192 domain-containing protein [Lutibacter sp.]